MPVMDSVLLDKFRRFVYDKSDLHFSAKKLAFFERRLEGRMGMSGLPDLESYYAFLLENPSEADALIQELTTNQTYFFRNASQFKALGSTVIPGLVAAKNREVVSSWGKQPQDAPRRNPAMGIRVWCAGCSTGEEAYSVAFTLLDAVKYPRAWGLDVLATDISRDVLVTARRGIYQETSLRTAERGIRDRYMERVDDGWSVVPAARKIVRFFVSNIKDVTRDEGARNLRLEDEEGAITLVDAAGRFDVIFCRNVMIYFDRGGQQRLVDALYDCLKPGGALFTGDSEPLHLFRHGFIRAADSEALYYIKPE